MSIPSNLYAEKIYAEHPNALFALDEKCDFVSYLSDNISTWTPTPAYESSSTYTLKNDSPIEDIYTNNIFIDHTSLTSSNSYTQKILSSSFTIPSGVDAISSSFYLYVDSQYIDKVSISLIGETTETSDEILLSQNTWKQIHKTFFGKSGTFQIQINIVFKSTVVSETETINSFINGFSVAYKSESFMSESSGVQIIDIATDPNNTDINFTGYGVKAYQYGTSDNYGYYIANNSSKKLYANNSGFPLVYGASNSTVLYPNPDGPSLVIPGYGFLNESGKYQTLVLETWLRIKSFATSSPRKIMGPIGNDNGLYVYGPHLIFKIGKTLLSHYVGEWSRPILVHIELDNGTARLFINGEFIDSDEYDFDTLSEKYIDLKDNDYLGFYAYDDVSHTEVDCVAIYPYKINTTVALRRFAYGQAAKLPENITNAYGGIQVVVDYEKAGYKNVKKYPDVNWSKVSYKENILSNAAVLSTPVFKLPEIILSETFGENEVDTSVWESDLQQLNIDDSGDGFITIRPNTLDNPERWNNVHGYLFIDSLNIFGTANQIKTIYGIFEKPETETSIEQVLFKLEDENNGDHLFVSLLEDNIYYRYKIGSDSGTLHTSAISSGTQTFSVGLNISKLSQKTSLVYELFENINSLQLFIGGDYSGIDKEVSTTFDGKIIEFAICTNDNSKPIINYFNANGAITSYLSNVTQFQNHNASYKIHNSPLTFGSSKNYNIDISSSSIVTNYESIMSFAKYVDSSYTVDFIQFNIDYPESPIADSTFDTSQSLVKTYIAFYYTNTKNPLYPSDIETTVSLNENNVVYPESSWSNKKYEVVDGTIIYIPKTFPSGKSLKDLKIVVYVEILSPGTNRFPIGIRSMRLTPVSLSTISKNTIGTKYGVTSLYPTTSDGYAPYSINNSNGSYLYLTNKTGIKLLDSLELSPTRKISFDINPNSEDLFYIGSLSVLSNFTSLIPTGKIKLFELQTKDGTISVYLNRLDGESGSISDRGILSATNSSGYSVSTYFYLNGIFSESPVIEINQWTMIGLAFSEPLSFNRVIKPFSINGSILVNNISFYKVNATKLEDQVVFKKWYEIRTQNWGYYTISWNEISVQYSGFDFAVSPKTIHSLYTGTNKFFATDQYDSSGIKLKDYQYSAYTVGTWQQNVLPAV